MNKFGYVMASKMLIDNRRKVRFMYRDIPDNAQDSGWRFFCGDEDQSYVDNPENIAIYDVNTILDIDPSVQKHLSAIPGTALERECDEDSFIFSESFVPVGEGV